MKAYLFVVALTLFAACGKKNDVAVLEHEALMLQKYYKPKFEALDARMQEIFKEGKTIPGTAPGVDLVGQRLQEARAELDKLKSIVNPPPPRPGEEKKPTADDKSVLEQQAETLAKEGKTEELEKLVHDTETTFNRGITLVNDSFDTVEGWVVQYKTKTLAMSGSVAPKAEEASPAPAQPDGVNPAQPMPAPAPPQPAPKK